MRRRTMTATLTAAASLLLLVASARAQDPTPPKTFPLNLQPYPGLPSGKVTAMSGVVDASGHHFLLDGLGVLQPAAVTLLAKNVDDDLTLILAKDRWDKPERSGSTRGTGQVTFRFRTWGEVKILVRSSGEARPYDLIVWAGEELEAPVPPAFVPISEYQKRHPEAAASGGGVGRLLGGTGSPALWIIAGALRG